MEKILEILQEIRPEFDFEESTNFIEDGYLDSFDITTLVADLEDEFDCLIDGFNVKADNFISLEAIANLVKMSGGNLDNE